MRRHGRHFTGVRAAGGRWRRRRMMGHGARMARRRAGTAAQLGQHHFAWPSELVSRRVGRRAVRRVMMGRRYRARPRRRNWLIARGWNRSRGRIRLRRSYGWRRSNGLHELLLYRDPWRSHHTLRRRYRGWSWF